MTSWSFRGSARTSKQAILKQKGMRSPHEWQCCCPCAHWQPDLFAASQCRPPRPLGLLKGLAWWIPVSWSFHVMCCQIFDIKLKQHCHSPRITYTLNCKTEMKGNRHKDWSQAVKAAEWDNYRELLNRNGANTKGCSRISKLQRQWSTRWREIWFGKLCCCHYATR